MADLQELVSRLKAQTSDQASAHSQTPSQPSIWAAPHPYQQPSVSSPLVSPPIHTPNPIHSSNIISPALPSSAAGTPGPDQNKTNTLLSLLKFNNQPGQPANVGPMASLHNIGASRSSSMHTPSIEARDGGASRPLSASDLMATFQRQQSSSGLHYNPMGETPSSSNPQDILLGLLTKPKSQQPSIQPIGPPDVKRADVAETRDSDIASLTKRLAETAVKAAETQRAPTPVRQFGSPATNVTQFEAPQPTKASMFNYINPFDQLHTSSPLNRGPKVEAQPEVKKFEILKHDRDHSSGTSEPQGAPAVKTRKLEDGDDVTATASAESDGKQRSVSEALVDVGEAVDKQVERALTEPDAQSQITLVSNSDPVTTDTVTKSKSGAKQASALKDEVDSSWESAGDDEDVSKSDEYKVEVYNFPMKPFVSLQIRDTPKIQAIRQENFMVIAQLKKEFDQIDRLLVTASQTHIVYAQVATKKDNGGFRVIRQDSGDHKQIFRASGERIFSVQLCAGSGTASDVETVLGTGVNGSVFWTSLDKSRGDVFADDDIQAQGFIMPPITTTEENTSGSPVKTRARLSSRHPEFFAVARGKQIFIVSPQVAKNPVYYNSTTQRVDSEAFFTDHTLKINTGKAGKDFCFSEDDTVIVSLDKNGRFKFWDIRELTNRATDDSTGRNEPVELREPLWTMNAAASGSKPEEKPSVSSIMFLDKERPVAKGMALRYVIIGFKQNHILQLWDLGLGKAVQEIRLPHEKDSDGICSISYHPKTGIVAIGHPTRNSIYFVHLSAPKYNIPHMQQAQYINMVAHGDPGLPKPESTAIMSGLREFSFAKVGQIRSVDMLKIPVENGSERNSVDETMFELYVMHSKGVVGIGIKRNDLGWDAQNKMINPKDAKSEGLIEISELIQPPKLPTSSEPGSATDTVSKPVGKPVKTPPAPKNEARKESVPAQASANGIRGKDVSTDKAPSKLPPSQAHAQLPVATEVPTVSVSSTKSPTTRTSTTSPPAPSAVESNQVARDPIVPTGGEELSSVMSKHFDSLYQRIDSDKRVQDATAGARQEALLRVVSSTLTENVERSLSAIITNRIEKDVIPVLADTTTKLIDRKLGELVPQQLSASLTGVIKNALPNALHHALKDKEIHRVISESTANTVATKVQQNVSQLLQQSLPDMATQATKKMIHDLETRTSRELQRAASQHEQDSNKIEELSSLVHGLSTVVRQMSESQAAMHAELLQIKHEIKAQQPVEDSARTASANAPATTQSPPVQPVDDEIMQMTQLLQLERYEEATIQWISSDRQAEIFDKLFVRVNPQYLELLSPLVALTVSAAITSSFDTFIEKRLDWLGSVLAQINIRDPDIKDVAPKIMDVLSQRLQGVYIELSEANPRTPCLKEIATLNRQVADIRRMAG